jgi:parallel beta-helix repeat protein
MSRTRPSLLVKRRPQAALPFPLLLLLALTVLAPAPAPALTIEVSTGGAEYIRPGDVWRFFRGRQAPSNPPDAWKEPAFDDAGWESGPSGFGYGDGDDATVLADMQGNYLTVYIRKAFTAGEVPADALLELEIDYDDGFIAYLNGREVARRAMPAGAATYQTPAAVSREAGAPERIALGKAADLLSAGGNLLAIEGHNASIGSSDFSLIPALRSTAGAVRDGAAWITTAPAAPLHGTTSDPSVVAVKVNGAPAAFAPAARTWEGEVALVAGRNPILVEALDAASRVVESGAIEVLYVPPSNRLGGALTGDAVWSGVYLLEEDVTVPAGVCLAVEPGSVILLGPGVSLRISGMLEAAGTPEAPIRFTRYGEGRRWKQLFFAAAADSRLEHCIIEHADSEGEHQDYYLPGPRSYHEAVVVLASHLDVLGCLFHKLPDDRPGAEGDAIAVIADDPELPGEASAAIRRSSFLSIGQGVHTRYSYVLVEECHFEGKRGDNDDVDLWGESDPPPLIRNNFFGPVEQEDRINPTRCSAIITGNILLGSTDHGIVLRDRSSPIVMNNLIIGCPNGGIAIENSCTALLVNNTIVDCGRGLRLFDLGRWGPPYNLNPGGGTATVINCIIWNCPRPVTLEDSSNTQIADRGSHVTILHSLIQGGRGGVSVSGSQSTVTWGEGNIEADPLFAGAAAGDYRLSASSPALDAGTLIEAPGLDLDGNPRPCGKAVDLGAYERCETLPPRFRRGDVNQDGGQDISDAVAILLYLFASGREPRCLESADVDGDGVLRITDALALLGWLFQGRAAPPPPFESCGFDPTPGLLGCAEPPPCG